MANAASNALSEQIDMDIEAKRVLGLAGCYSDDYDHYDLLNDDKNHIKSGMSFLNNAKQIMSTHSNLTRNRVPEAKSHAHQLRRTVCRIGKRRERIARLHKKLIEIPLGDQPMSDGDNMDHERAMEEVTDRILLEISVMKHDKAFAKKLMEKLAEDIDGL